MIELDDQFALLGDEVSLEQAEVIKRRGYQLIEQAQQPIQVDLAALQRANSVTVGLLVAWQRRANLQGKSIVFVNLSNDLRNIIEFSGLSRVLIPA